MECFTVPAEQEDRHVLSEWIEVQNEEFAPGRMVRRGQWKYVAFAHDDCSGLLFDLQEDPEEVHDVSAKYPQIARDLQSLLNDDWEIKRIVRRHIEEYQHRALIHSAPPNPLLPREEHWNVPECARQLPEVR